MIRLIEAILEDKDPPVGYKAPVTQRPGFVRIYRQSRR